MCLGTPVLACGHTRSFNLCLGLYIWTNNKALVGGTAQVFTVTGYPFPSGLSSGTLTLPPCVCWEMNLGVSGRTVLTAEPCLRLHVCSNIMKSSKKKKEKEDGNVNLRVKCLDRCLGVHTDMRGQCSPWTTNRTPGPSLFVGSLRRCRASGREKAG